MTHESEIDDINDLVVVLAGIGVKPLLNDEIWQCYGYRKRPVKGNIWNKLFPKIFSLQNFISKEVLTMGLIDILNGIKKSAESHKVKLLLMVGVTDQFLATTGHIFPPDEFMENLFSSYKSYSQDSKSGLHGPIILKAKDVLDKKDFARFMVGTIKLLAAAKDDFLLRSNLIKDTIDKSAKKNQLRLSMSKEMYRKYGPLLEENILNS